MRKWVIKQPFPNSPMQVWEYIDSYEEASKYWYVAQAMRDYGVDDVLPIAMNSMGGYHSINPNSETVIAIVESATKPKLDLIQAYPIAKGRVRNGWMSPECVIYTCDPYGHISCAERLCDEFYDGPCYKDDRNNLINAPDEKLYNKGWVKIISGQWLAPLWEVNDAQLNRLEELDIKRF